MQSGTSSRLAAKSQNSMLSRGTKGVSSQGANTSSRARNSTSAGPSMFGPSERTRIYAEDGRNITPKSLVPSQYLVDTKGTAPGTAAATVPSGSSQEQPAEAGVGHSFGEDVQLEQMPPSPDKLGKTKPASLPKPELERNVDIVLAETETSMLISISSLTVCYDNPNYTQIVERNKAYDELCSSKADSDAYREQHAQTFNQQHKSKEVFAAPPSTETVEVNANGWDIWDTFAIEPVPKHDQIQQACAKESAASVALAIKKPGCLFTLNEPYPAPELPPPDAGATKADPRKSRRDKPRTGLSTVTGALGNSSRLFVASDGGLSSGPTTGSGPTTVLGGDETKRVQTLPTVGEHDTTAPTHLSAQHSTTNSQPLSAAATVLATEVNASSTETKAEDAVEEIPDEAAEPEPMDVMPWKVGTDTPIPDEIHGSLRTMERIVAQNYFHRQHMIYRNYPTLEELAKLDEQRMAEEEEEASAAGDPAASTDALSPSRSVGLALEGDGSSASGAGEAGDEAGEEASREDNSAKPSLEDLFTFNAPQLTTGLSVTCAEWNRHNQDLLAVSYGDTTPVPMTQGGLVLFWSLKNPTYPERVIRTRHGITALHFSTSNANMVAAGTSEGSVMIWDLRRPTDVPVLKSGSSASANNDKKHTDIVWETRWVAQGHDKQPPELLVSVSSDGNVLQWSMKKGLEQSLLMSLKRLQNPHLGANSVYGHKEGVIFRKSSGLCVDFPRHDPSTYLVGTEDGLVHRCSTSYNEQYLDTYYGHCAAVYKVRCNPFMSYAFLTCSADWTVKLWSSKPMHGHPSDAPLLTFQSTDLFDSVNDVSWSPMISTTFAAAMDDGRVELWDLAEKPLDPIVIHYPQADKPQQRRTCVRFSPNSPVLVAGDYGGSVDVMRMYNTNQSYYSDQEQQDRLNAVMVKKR